MAGVKHDEGKNRLDLIPIEPLLEVGKVLTVGAKKYGDYNWKKGILHSRLFAAVLRHIFAYRGGENNAPDTGLDHRAHAIAGLMFTMDMPAGWDDRTEGL